MRQNYFAGIKLIFTFVPPFKNGAIAQLVEQRTENPCVPGSIPGGTTKKAPRICERLFFCHPSSFRPCFEDGTLIFCHPSSYKPVFEDGTLIFCHPSSFRPCFEDGTLIFCYPSSYRPVFEDGTLIFCYPSSYKPVFEDGTLIFCYL